MFSKWVGIHCTLVSCRNPHPMVQFVYGRCRIIPGPWRNHFFVEWFGSTDVAFFLASLLWRRTSSQLEPMWSSGTSFPPLPNSVSHKRQPIPGTSRTAHLEPAVALSLIVAPLTASLERWMFYVVQYKMSLSHNTPNTTPNMHSVFAGDPDALSVLHAAEKFLVVCHTGWTSCWLAVVH